MKRVISSILIFSISLLQPIALFAQQNTVIPPQRRVYNPNVQIDSTGGTYNGVRFNGVGAAVLNCTNVAQKATVSIGEFSNNNSQKIRLAVKNRFDDFCNANQNNKTCINIRTKANSQFLNAPNSLGLDPVAVNDSNVQAQLNRTNAEIAKINTTNNCLNGIAYAVAKNALQQVTYKTLNWVNTGGLYGGPLYMTNINAYMRQLTDTKINNFLQTENVDPIFGNSIRSVIQISRSGINDGRINRLANNGQSIAYQNFQNDFTLGGWNSFMNMGYNSVGALFKASDKLGRNISIEQKNVQNELIAGNGFMSVRDQNGNITTPGYIVANQVATITTAQARQLEMADAYNEVVGSFFDRVLNNLFNTNKGLLGVNSSSFTNNNGFLDQTGTVLNNNGDNPLNYTSSNNYSSGNLLGEFDISKPQYVRSILQTQKDFLNASLDSSIAMSRIVPTLGALDYCIPGPNPTWPDYLNENYETFINNISDKQKFGKKIDITPIAVSVGSTIGAAALTGAVLGSAVPGLGTIIGVAAGLLVGTVIKLSTGNKVVTTFYSQPSVYDKVTDSYVDVAPFYFAQQTKRKNAPTLDGLKTSLDENYPGLLNTYKAVYSTSYIEDAFLTAKSKINAPTINTVESGITSPVYEYDEPDEDENGNPVFTGGYNPNDSANNNIITYTPTNSPVPSFDLSTIEDMMGESKNLNRYNNIIADLSLQYQEVGANNIIAVAELEDINKEVQKIVKKAKARYIEEQSSKGTPVNLTCLNNEYIINENAVLGMKRQESDVEDPIVKKSLESGNYFYDNIKSN